MTRDPNAPSEVDPETTAGFRERAAERLARLEATVATKEWVDETVTGARRSLEAKIVSPPSPDKIEAIVTDVNSLATKESVDRLKERIDNLGLPKFWQLVTLAVVLAGGVGSIVWRAHDEVSELRERIHVIEVRLEAMDTLTKVIASQVGKRP